MLFLADGYAVSEKYPEAIAQTVTVRPEPLTLLSALSAVTEHVGLLLRSQRLTMSRFMWLVSLPRSII